MGDQEREELEVRPDFLFARPSFWSGLGRWLDLSGRFDFYNISRDGETADALALYSDWRMVGQELRRACRAFGNTVAAQGELFGKSGWQSRDEQSRRRRDTARITGSIIR